MFKKTIAACLVATFFLTGAAFCEKIAVLDFRSTFESYNKTKEYEEVLNAKRDEVRVAIEDRLKKIEEMENKLATYNQKKQEAEKQKIDKERNDLENYRREEWVNLRKEYQDKLTEIRNDVINVVEGYAKKHELDLIIDKSLIVYNKESFDITEKILALLNSKSN